MTSIKFQKSSAAADVKTGLKAFKEHVKSDAKEIVKDFKDGSWKTSNSDLVKDLKNAASTFGAELIGVAELKGMRYSVAPYQSKVSNGLTRGSRLEGQQEFANLKQQGFKSTVDLTLEGTGDADLAPKVGLNTFSPKILDNSAPSQKQIVDVLNFVTKPENSPAFIHCQAGKGRTGVAVAAYRMAVEGWSSKDALAEGAKFGMSLPDQVAFIEQFGKDLKAGKIEGYPLK
jgi:protein-tyrosine phosphatase